MSVFDNPTKPLIMAILNVTPDSFSDGGKLYRDGKLHKDTLLRQVQSLVDEGADILDIGGESTRPGAEPVSVSEELDRTMTAIEAVRSQFDVPISLDSSTAQVMTEGIKRGVSMLNDVRAFQRDGALSVAASSELPLCIMHMKGTPKTMQANPEYQDVVTEVESFLVSRQAELVDAGAARSNVWFDPGFGFAKTLEHNLSLLNGLSRLAEHAPLLVGMSKKRMVGDITEREVDERVVGSAIVGYHALLNGAKILRVHDVASTRDAVRIYQALSDNNNSH